jgi:flagellar hook-associated protein 2
MPQSFLGIGSGFDIQGMIDALMAIERRPVLKWRDRQLELEKKKDAWRDINTRLKTLRDKTDVLIGEMIGATMWTAAKATSADESVVKVTPGSEVAVGTYDIRVRRLATASTSKSSAQLNTKYSVVSRREVVAGLDKKLNLEKSFAEAGFDTTPDGTITITVGTNSWTSDDLSSYSTVQDFIDAVNENSFINMRYDKDTDRFIIEKTSLDTNALEVSESGTNGFLTEVNITPGSYTSNNSGIDPSAKLYKANFDNPLGETDSGSFKINGVEIYWDADVDTLNGIIGRINRSDAGVTAFYDESLDKIMITSKEMGANNIEISDVSGTFAASTLLLPSLGEIGQTALFTINSTSLSDEIEKDANVFTIGGVTYELKKISSGIDEAASNPYTSAEPTKITVVKDEEGIFKKIKEFVEQFNSVMEFIHQTTKTSEKKIERGDLAGEVTVVNIRDALLGFVTNSYPGLDQEDFDELAEIGITTAKYVQGAAVQLEIDENKLKEVIRDHPTKVENLFGKDTDGDLKKDEGVAVKIIEYLKPLTKFGGILERRVQMHKNFIRDLDERIDRFEENLVFVEERYKRAFTAMDQAYATMQHQMNMLFGTMTFYRYK